MAKEIEILLNFLGRKNLKLTNQRRIILDTFLKTEKHLSVEDLYEMVKKRNPEIGHATVFRTLRLLRDADIAKEVDLGDKRVRYEHKYGHKHHDHLVCVKCGSFIEVVDQTIEKQQKRLCKKVGFMPQWHKMEIYGVCRRCRK